MMFGRDYPVHGDQRIEETPRGIDRMISVLCGMISVCDMIGRLHVPDRTAIHPLTDYMTCQRVQRACTAILVDLALLGLLKLLLPSKSFGLSSSLDCLGFRFGVSDR